jgi:hypothetical protein
MEESDMKIRSQSLDDIASYPYPTRIEEEQSGASQPSEAVYDIPLVSSEARLTEQRPVVVFVYPGLAERLHLESVQFEKQVQNWEDEGGSLSLIPFPWLN